MPGEVRAPYSGEMVIWDCSPTVADATSNTCHVPQVSSSSRAQRPQSLTKAILSLFFRLRRNALGRRRRIHLLRKLHARLVRNLAHKFIHVILRCRDSRSGRRRILVVSSRNVQVLELGLEAVHDGADL